MLRAIDRNSLTFGKILFFFILFGRELDEMIHTSLIIIHCICLNVVTRGYSRNPSRVKCIYIYTRQLKAFHFKLDSGDVEDEPYRCRQVNSCIVYPQSELSLENGPIHTHKSTQGSNMHKVLLYLLIILYVLMSYLE